MAQIRQKIDVKSVDKLARILGAFDENLNFLSAQLSLVAYVEGVKIILEGEEKNVELGLDVLSALLKLEPDVVIDESKITYCIELAKEGRIGEIALLSGGVVAITAKGKQIKCKTIGQKQYVEAIKKDTVVFGVELVFI